MNKKILIKGEKIVLRSITPADVTEEYCSWLNDKEVGKYMETRFTEHTLESTKKYVKKVNADSNSVFLAIIRKDLNKFIGTIKLGDIYWDHGFGSIAIMIGDKGSWGKGFAAEAIHLFSDFSFKYFKIHKLLAGTYEDNIGSVKTFKKAGFNEEFRQKKQYLSDGKYVDRVVLVKFKE
ncbi:GNAT family N-acetyltransferase [Candidatus Giovannonibacteria bacterium]|nr:GNAT family N-acetyltransferase [Candidatus Giovannonibacteria bacterium]